MILPKRSVVSILRQAARWLDKSPARITVGACFAIANIVRWRYSPYTDHAGEILNYFEGLFSLYEADARKHGPITAWWGINFGAYRDWKARMREFNSLHGAIDTEVAKSGRILMLLFLAEMVEQGDL